MKRLALVVALLALASCELELEGGVTIEGQVEFGIDFVEATPERTVADLSFAEQVKKAGYVPLCPIDPKPGDTVHWFGPPEGKGTYLLWTGYRWCVGVSL